MKNEMDRVLSPLIFTNEKKQETLNMVTMVEHAEDLDAQITTKALSRKSRPLRKLVLLAACLTVLSGAMAFAVGPKAISSQLRALLIPVNESTVYEDIKLTVVSAVADEDTTVILFTLEDLASNRIDDTLLLDEYHVAGASVMGCEPVGYDEETGVLTMMIRGSGSTRQSSRVSLSITSLLPGGRGLFDQFTDVDVASLLALQEELGNASLLTRNEDAYKNWNVQLLGENRIATSYQEQFNATDEMLLLDSGNLNIPVHGASWLQIDNIAYVDGWLHIRTKNDLELAPYNHGYFYLADENGQPLDIATLNKPYVTKDYEEYIFKVAREDLEQYQLWGSFTAAGDPIPGQWNIAFDLEAPETLHWQGEQILSTDSGSMLEAVTISTLGVTLKGQNLQLAPEHVTVHLNDGSVLVPGGGSTSQMDEQGNSFIKLTVYWPELEMDQVKAVRIDEVEIPMQLEEALIP